MSKYTIQNAYIELEDPIIVTGQVDHCWFPQIARFPSGTLIVTVSLVPDAHSRRFHTQGILISEDGGSNWEWAFTVSGGHRGVIHVRDDDSMSLIGTVSPVSGTDWRAFTGPSIELLDNGRRLVVEREAISVEGLPRPVKQFEPERVYPGTENRGWQIFNGDVLEIDGGFLTTMYLKYRGDDRYTTIALESTDAKTWRYRGEIAGPSAAPDAPEGPCEPGMVRLASGELMCVLRVGGGSKWKCIRAYSADDGKTWSESDTLPAWSVEPCLRVLSDGTLALSTGRTGIHLWISRDGRGEQWESVDIIEHHNRWADGEEHRIDPEAPQTTAYTQMVEAAPGRLLLVYDRVPNGWKPVEKTSEDRNKIYVLPVQIVR